jgi:hypothetical protein
MSYGEWKTRGKNWAHLEIDSPWNWTFDKWEHHEYDSAEKAGRAMNSLLRQWRTFDLHHIDGLSWESNPTAAKFIAYQAGVKGRMIVMIPNGEHQEYFAFDKEYYQSAMNDFAERRLKEHKESYKVLNHEPTEDQNPQLDLKHELIRMFEAMMKTDSFIDFDYTKTAWHSWVLAMNHGETHRADYFMNLAQGTPSSVEVRNPVEVRNHPIW